MNLTVDIDPTGQCKSLQLTWQLPGQPHSTSLYLLPEELTPTRYPHAVNDLSRVAVFYGDHFKLFHGDRVVGAIDSVQASAFEIIYCNTNRLLEVLRTLHARKVAHTVLDTARFRTVQPAPARLGLGEIAAHPNLVDRDRLGKTLKHFWKVLTAGPSDRTFADLKADLSRLLAGAKVFAQGDEFYFNGRIPGGCGFNGGLLPHTSNNSYGIHT